MERQMSKTKRATLIILTLLGLLAFASASGAFRAIYTPAEDIIICEPQRVGPSDNLWTCTDYHGNKFRNLIISEAL
jgi:hypothetical protein